MGHKRLLRERLEREGCRDIGGKRGVELASNKGKFYVRLEEKRIPRSVSREGIYDIKEKKKKEREREKIGIFKLISAQR